MTRRAVPNAVLHRHDAVVRRHHHQQHSREDDRSWWRVVCAWREKRVLATTVATKTRRWKWGHPSESHEELEDPFEILVLLVLEEEEVVVAVRSVVDPCQEEEAEAAVHCQRKEVEAVVLVHRLVHHTAIVEGRRRRGDGSEHLGAHLVLLPSLQAPLHTMVAWQKEHEGACEVRSRENEKLVGAAVVVVVALQGHHHPHEQEEEVHGARNLPEGHRTRDGDSDP